jgi:hypothetical protein
MLQRTNKLLIGKDINRDQQVVDGAVITTMAGSTGLADGEVVVLDKNFCVLGAGKTIADTDIIYICQGTGDTFTYSNELLTGVLATRRLIFSDPIEGAFVRKYVGTAYAAATEQNDTWTLTGMVPVVGTEYIVRIVYKDMNEHPGQFTQTYRITATDALLATWVVAMNAKINAHSGRRVDSTTNTTTTLVLTGRHIDECTTGLTDIEEFRMVEFSSYILYIDADGNWTEIVATSATPCVRTPAEYGSGTGALIRDYERRAMPYRGITNYTVFPFQYKSPDTVFASTYNLITIESDKQYLSPDNQYVKRAPLTTVIAFVVPSSGNQQDAVLAQLNGWMASCPGAFDGIAF